MMTIVGWKWTAYQVVKILQTIAWCGMDTADMRCGAWLTVSDRIPTQPCMEVLQTRQVDSEEGKSEKHWGWKGSEHRGCVGKGITEGQMRNAREKWQS